LKMMQRQADLLFSLFAKREILKNERCTLKIYANIASR
jgi:hypothetical protein